VRKGGSVITRVWRGWAPADRARQYDQHYRPEVLAVRRFDDHVDHDETAFETS
jgi:hypothetical protein